MGEMGEMGDLSGSREPSPAVSALSGFDPGRFAPLPQELYELLPSDRERALHAIADQVAYWLKWETGKRGDEGLATDENTHVWLNGFDGAPPHWPHVGQLKRWLVALRATPELGQAVNQ